MSADTPAVTVIQDGKKYNMNDTESICVTLDDGKGKTMTLEAMTPLGVELHYAEGGGPPRRMTLDMAVVDMKITEEEP